MYRSLLVVGPIYINRFSIFLVFFPTIQSIQTHFNFLQIFFYNFSILLKGFDTEEPAILSKYFIGMCVCTNNETFALVVRK